MGRKEGRRNWKVRLIKAMAAIGAGILICLLSALLQNPYYRYGGGYQAVFWRMKGNMKNQQMQMVEMKRQVETKKHIYGGDYQTNMLGSLAAGENSYALMSSNGGTGSVSAGASREIEMSSTNARTEGVEEGDTVKTDGNYIYAYRQRSEGIVCYIYEANQEKTKKIASFCLNAKNGLEARDMYLSNGKLIFVAEQSIPTYKKKSIRELYQKAGSDFRGFCEESWREWNGVWEAQCTHYYNTLKEYNEEEWAGDACYTRTLIYDVSDPHHPVVEKELFQDGCYEGSRLVDNALYVLSSRTMNIGAVQHQQEKTYIPQVGGECVPDDKVDMSAEGSEQFQILSSVDIISGKYLDKRAVLGGSSQIYVSRDAIYLMDEASWNGQYRFAALLDKLSWKEDRSFAVYADRYLRRYGWNFAELEELCLQHLHPDDRTGILKYSYKDGKIKKEAEGKIRGYLDSDYALDEQDGYLRAVTTYYSDITAQDKNAVYILDKHLNVSGKLLNIAPDESVYAVRFMGDIAYFVTYEETDPVFTVDLSDPSSPEIIGELELPGFSTYMHPLGEHLLLGIGQTDSGKLKLSLFDTTDPMHVREILNSALPYSDSWECDVLDNPNALFIDEKRQMFGFGLYGYDNRMMYLAYRINEEESFTEMRLAEQEYDGNRWQDFSDASASKLYDEEYDTGWEVYYDEDESSSFGENTRGLYIGQYFYVVNPGETIEVYTYPEFKKCG